MRMFVFKVINLPYCWFGWHMWERNEIAKWCIVCNEIVYDAYD